MKVWKSKKWAAVGLGAVLALSGCGPEGLEGTAPKLGKTSSALLADDVYNQLRGIENLVPPLQQQEIVDMGTFDVVNNVFTGKDWSYALNPVTHKPYPVPYQYTAHTRNLVLQFTLINSFPNGYPLWLTIGSHSVYAPAGSQTISVNLGAEGGGAWTLTAGPVGHNGAITFSRRNVNGMGAFTLDALPITLVWEPPMNQAATNSASMTISQQTTSVDEFVNQSDSSYKGESQWSEMSEAAGVVWQVAAGIASLPPQAASGIASGLGSLATTTEYGASYNSDHTLGLTTSSTVTVTTALHKGPGLGDVFFFYRNPKIAWFMVDGNITTTLLDPGTMVQTTASTLKDDLAALQAGTKTVAQTQTQLAAATIQHLLALDPAGLPAAEPGAQPRFVKQQTLSLSGGNNFVQSEQWSLTSTDKLTQTTYTSTVTDSHKGWLSALGLAFADSTGTTTSKLTLSSSHSDSVTQSQTTQINLSTQAGETYNADVYFDRLFGTFRVYKPRQVVCIVCGPGGPIYPPIGPSTF